MRDLLHPLPDGHRRGSGHGRVAPAGHRTGAPKPEGNVPLFNRAFLKTVETFGRSYEIGMITAYKIGTMKLMNDTEKFPAMLKKGKIALLPPKGGDKKTVKRSSKKSKRAGKPKHEVRLLSRMLG